MKLIKFGCGLLRKIQRRLWATYNKAKTFSDILIFTKNIETSSWLCTTTSIFPNSHIYLQVKSEKEYHTMLIGSWKFTHFCQIILSLTATTPTTITEYADPTSIFTNSTLKLESFSCLITNLTWTMIIKNLFYKKIWFKEIMRHWK